MSVSQEVDPDENGEDNEADMDTDMGAVREDESEEEQTGILYDDDAEDNLGSRGGQTDARQQRHTDSSCLRYTHLQG